jgi:CRISPR-associated protein Cas1
MLNYGYAVLESEAWRAIHYAGLDPYGGFLHVDRPGRPSMVLDLMEEFRQQVIDKTIFTFFSRNQVKPRQFTVEDGVCVMDDKPRKLLLSTLLSKMEEHTRYKNKKMRWTDLVLTQARKIGKFLRRETKTYKGFWSRW